MTPDRIISRRDFLKIAGAAGAGLLIAPWLNSCATKPTQEQFSLIETIDLAVPGLTAEKYKVKFDEMSVPFWTRWQIQSWVADDKNFRANRGGGDPLKNETWWASNSRCGSSFIGLGQHIELFDEFSRFYFDGQTGKFYKDIIPDRDYKNNLVLNKAGEIDRKILGWSELWTYLGPDISCNGKVLYTVYLPSYADSQYLGPRNAVIIADILNSSKVVIKNKEGSDSPIVGILSEERNKLLLSFAYGDKDEKRGSYLVDLSNWKVIFQTDIASREPFLNKDGSLLDVNSGLIGDDIDHVYDTNTGGEEKDVIKWPTFLTSYEHKASPNLNFIARKVGEFASAMTVEGQWGIFVHTPEGIFYIHSPQKSLVPEYVSDDGTIYTYDCIFKFVNDTYQLSETTERDKFDVLIGKVSDD